VNRILIICHHVTTGIITVAISHNSREYWQWRLLRRAPDSQLHCAITPLQLPWKEGRQRQAGWHMPASPPAFTFSAFAGQPAAIVPAELFSPLARSWRSAASCLAGWYSWLSFSFHRPDYASAFSARHIVISHEAGCRSHSHFQPEIAEPVSQASWPLPH